MKPKIVCLSLVLSLGLVTSAPVLAQYMGEGSGPGSARANAPTQESKIQEWFGKYDNIRRQAQMNPQERAKADAAMSQGLTMSAGAEKGEMQAFLRTLSQRDVNAANQLKQLPLYPETEKLHRGYYQYFTEAAKIFNDYIIVQDNLFAKDAKGQSIAAGMLAGKQNLEMIDQNNKALDAQLRAQFNIAPYHYP